MKQPVKHDPKTNLKKSLFSVFFIGVHCSHSVYKKTYPLKLKSILPYASLLLFGICCTSVKLAQSYRRQWDITSLLVTITTYWWQQYKYKYPWKFSGACDRHQQAVQISCSLQHFSIWIFLIGKTHFCLFHIRRFSLSCNRQGKKQVQSLILRRSGNA